MTGPKITKAEFIRQYCKRSDIREETLAQYRAVLRCYCGDPSCEGWACVPLDIVDWHKKTDGVPREPNQP